MRYRFLAVAALTITAACTPVLAQAPTSARTMTSESFHASHSGAVLIDVREPGEWSATGVPAQAKTISITRKDFVDAVLAEVGGDMSKPVAVICKSGTRSARAAQQLASAGFSNVIDISDGMLGQNGVGKGWLGAGLPTRTPDGGRE